MSQDTNKKTKNSKKLKWIRFSIWTMMTILFSIWTQSFWWLLAIPMFLDLYITRYFPWGFWKKSKNKYFKSIMDWVDAIVFALIAVYIINIYFFQNYQIPSSSLEKSLLVGDFLFVSKASYGPRVPNTPLAFPLAHHTIPGLNIKSYSDKPHWGYKRVPGLGKIKRNDIVVFNYPAGDSVTITKPIPDYYTLSYTLGRQYQTSTEVASNYIKNNPDLFGKLVYRPVDRREHYVKRCIGLPGETLVIKNNHVFIDGVKIEEEPGVQFNYFVQTKGGYITETMFQSWGITKEDYLNSKIDLNELGSLGLPFHKNTNGAYNPVYILPATKSTLNKIKNNPFIDTAFIEPDIINGMNFGGPSYPLTDQNSWTRDNYGPIWIPAKGATIKLTLENLPIYLRVIENYEGQSVDVINQKIHINGKVVQSYTFQMDYYWMMGDNRHNSADSRSWGFVPEDHVVGKPILVWLSLDKDKSLFEGKIRWNRFFKRAY